MIKKLLSAMAVIALALNVASCGHDEPEQYQTFGNQVIAHQNVGGEMMTSAGRVSVKIYSPTPHADLTIPMMVNGAWRQVMFTDLTVTMSNTEGYILSSNSAVACDESGKSLGFNVSSLSAKIQITNPTSAEHENIVISCVVDSRLYFASLGKITHHKTSTVTSSPMGSYTCQDAIYTFNIDADKKTASIVINNIKFVEKAPVLSEITIPAVTLTETNDGYTVTADEVIPTSAGVPMENRKITNLALNLRIAQGTFDGMFNCMGMTCNCTGDIAFRGSNE